MNTITVDIKETDLMNFMAVTQIELKGLNEEFHTRLFKQYPFTLYSNRMHGNHMLTIQIPISDYVIYLGFGLVK